MNITFTNIQNMNNKDTRSNYEYWQSFRDTNREYLHKKAFVEKSINKGKLLVLGAGNGNDIDIEYLEDQFNEITLVDIDKDALDIYLGRVKNVEKYKTHLIDLSGVMNQIKPEVFGKSENVIRQHLKSLRPKIKFNELENNYDLILNCNYTTQLLHPYITSVLLANNKKLSYGIMVELSNLSKSVIETLFKEISSILSPDGLLIHSTDTYLMEHDKKTNTYNEAYIKINEILKGDINNLADIATHTRSLNKYQLAGSYIPFQKQFNYEGMRFAPWEFTDDEEKQTTYICTVVVLSKK